MGVLGGALFGGLFFLWIAGTRIIDPTQFEWLMKLDWRINFLGWHLFRADAWHWPPGRIENYLAGEGTTIGFTDSVPAAALPFKLFESWLPTPFQYFGLWLCLCFVLQGLFGALIARIYTRHPLLQLASAASFVLVPTLLMRVGHPALTAHFLLLWALWLYAGSDQQHPAPMASQTLLGLIAGLTHPYLAAMTLAMLASIPLRDRSRHALSGWLAAAAATVVAWWTGGFISVSNTTDLSAGGLGLYSMNLLSPITPRGWSTMLPELPVAHEMQAYEGFQYLGAGVLFLLVVASIVATTRQRIRWRVVVPMLAVCTACALYALSPRVTFGSVVIVDWTSPAIDRLAFFRASGRFFWPMTYVLLAGAVATVARLRTRTALIILVASLGLQFVDLANAHQERRHTSRSDAFHTWPRRLTSPAWEQMLPHYRHVVLVPASQCGGAPLEHEEIAYLAGLYGLTINSGLGARWDDTARRHYCGALQMSISAGIVADDAIYIVTPAHEQRLRDAARQPVVCGPVDAARVCVTEASYQAWRQAVPLSE
jgi:hypothetical protein